MTSVVDEREIPYVDSHTAQFLNFPNSVIGDGPERLRYARGRSGIEFFAYDTVRAMYREQRIGPRTPQFFLDKGLESGPIVDYLVEGNLNLTWPKTHDRLRPVLTRGFKPARIEQARASMAVLAEELVDRLSGQNTCNFVRDFSHHLSIGAIAGFIGIPFDEVGAFDNATVKLRLLGQEPIWPGVPELEGALQTVYDYSAELVERRRVDPRADYISDLLEAQDSGAKISLPELVWNIGGILLAGHDTTRYQMASCVRALAENGLWGAIVEDPSLIPSAVTESMRMYPATPRQVKPARQSVRIENLDFDPDEVMTLNITAAGRDPEAFRDPDRFDLHRPEPRFDIGFGHGAHYCLGWAVAKAEMEEGLKVLARRWRDVELVGDVEVVAGGVIAGPEVVPIRYRTVA